MKWIFSICSNNNNNNNNNVILLQEGCVGSKVVKIENVKQPSISFVSVSVTHYMTQAWWTMWVLLRTHIDTHQVHKAKDILKIN
jgi:hypothetical protein